MVFESISSKIRYKTTIIQHSFGSLSHGNQRRQRNKRNTNGKRSKTVTADDMILHIDNPKDVTRKLLELINESGKVAGYKINAQKSLVFLYTKNKRSEREINETIPLTIAKNE